MSDGAALIRFARADARERGCTCRHPDVLISTGRDGVPETTVVHGTRCPLFPGYGERRFVGEVEEPFSQNANRNQRR